MSVRFIELYNAKVSTCKLYEGILPTMKHLCDKGISHSVLSAAYEPDLLHLLERYEVKPLLTHIYGINNIHAAGKTDRALQLRDEIKDESDQIILIGDTAHDLEVAQYIGVDCLLIADGHYNVERLHSVHDNVLETKY